MNNRFRVRPIDLMVVGAIIGFVGYRGATKPVVSTGGTSEFAQGVDLEPLYGTAVQADGRLRSFESHARTYMGYVSGRRSIHGHNDGFTYLDMLFRPRVYQALDTVYVKNKNVRVALLNALEGHPHVDAERSETIQKVGLFSRDLLGDPRVVAELQRLGADLIRTSKDVDAIQIALTVSDPRFLEQALRMVPAPSGALNEPWISMAEIADPDGAPRDSVHAAVQTRRPIPGLDTAIRDQMANLWRDVRSAWVAEDAATVSEKIASLAPLFREVSPKLYPNSGRLSMESWYFRNKSMTSIWLIYLAAVVPLLMAVIYQWSGARRVGIVLFVLAFLFHTASVGVRWYISGRWPNANMFEAVTTAAWFGGLGALILEWVTRKSSLRNLFALGSAVMSMGALMAAYYLPAQLDSSISNKMAALNDIWLYIHTNMIIWSYAVIGIASVPALLLLRHRWCSAWDQRTLPRLWLWLLPVAVVLLNYSAYRLLMHALNDPARELSRSAFIGTTGTFWGSLLVLVLSYISSRNAGGTAPERAAIGGASSLILGGSSSFLQPGKPTSGQVLDGATMVLVELSFIMLWTGVVMGAIWADHSWGRPWGWDPKEVFALNTFVIFLVLIHVRLKVKDKAFWTAVLAVLGFEVMMFNWIVVNFIISGLHSYA